MSIKAQFPIPMISTAFAALLVAAPPVHAQGQQEATSMAMPGGSCGQSIGLTSIFALPLDTFAPVAPTRTMARHEPHFFEFRLSAPAQVRFQTSYPSGRSADPYLVLFDSSGAAIDWDDDGAGDLNALLDLPLQAGVYCIQMRMLGSPPQGPVDVTLDIRVQGAAGGGATTPSGQIGAVFAGDPSLPCGDPAATTVAGRLAPGFGSLRFDGQVPRNGSADWVMALDQTLSVRVEASDAMLDTVLTLRDAARNVVAENDDAPGMGTNSMIVETLVPGEYCVSISGYAGAGGSATLELFDASGGTGGGTGGGGAIMGDAEGGAPQGGGAAGGTGFVASGPCGDPARTQLLGRLARGFGTVAVAGNVPASGRQDWILSLADPGELRLDARSGNFDTVLEVFDTGGGLLAENDDSPEGGTDSMIIRDFAPGDYCVSVRGFAGAGGTLDLTVAETAQATPDTGLIGMFAAGQPCGDPATTEVLGNLQDGFLQIFAQGQVPPGAARYHAAHLRDRLNMTITATSGVFDTVLSVTDASGSLLAENDDGPGMGTDSQVVGSFGPGPVCFGVRGFGGGGGTFELAVYEDEAGAGGGGGMGGAAIIGDSEAGGPGGGASGQGGAALGPGPCGDAAQTISIGTLAADFGRLSMALQVPRDDQRNVAFGVSGMMSLRFETTETDFDTMLELHSAMGLVDENDDRPEGGTDSLIVATLGEGMYCAVVRGFAGAGGNALLVLTDVDAGGGGMMLEMPQPGDGVEVVDLGTLGADGLFFNRLASEGASWMQFRQPSPGLLDIQAINLTGPFVLALFEAETGDFVVDTASGGGLEPATIFVDVPAGLYVLGLGPDDPRDAGVRRIEIRPGG